LGQGIAVVSLDEISEEFQEARMAAEHILPINAISIAG